MEDPIIERAGDNEMGDLIEANLDTLQDYFINEVREYHEQGITKDNFESFFDQWLEDLDIFELREIIGFGEEDGDEHLQDLIPA